MSLVRRLIQLRSDLISELMAARLIKAAGLSLGILANYTIRIDLALVGTEGSDDITLVASDGTSLDGYTYVEARGGDDVVVGSEA